MDPEDLNPKTIVEHRYYTPPVEVQKPDSFRQISIVTLNQSIHLVSNNEYETMDFLVDKALSILSKIKENDKR